MKVAGSDDPLRRLRCKAILLDSDGVLVDSSDSVKAAFSRWADSYGLDGEAVYAKLHGHRASEVAAMALPAEQAATGAARLEEFELDLADVLVVEVPDCFEVQLGGSVS